MPADTVWFQLVTSCCCPVTAEAAGSSPVVPAIQSSRYPFWQVSTRPLGVGRPGTQWHKSRLNPTVATSSRRWLLRNIRFAPGAKVHPIEYEAKQIGRDEAQLRSFETYDADNDAVHRCQDPALPTSPAYQDGGKHR
jgi:hypothetical protein